MRIWYRNQNKKFRTFIVNKSLETFLTDRQTCKIMELLNYQKLLKSLKSINVYQKHANIIFFVVIKLP